MNMPFRPIQGTEEVITKQVLAPGFVYFATDSGKIFLDTEFERISVGGGGVAVLYASAIEIKEDLTDFSYLIYKTDLDNEDAVPKEGDLIINSDGRFFKVLSYNKDSGLMKCSLIAVSGTGGGGGGNTGGGGGTDTSGPYVTLKSTGTAPNAQVYIYEQAQNVEFTATATDDAIVTITYTITSVTDSSQTQAFSYSWPSGTPHVFDLGSKLYRGLNTLMVSAVGSNSGSATLRYQSINSIVLALHSSDSFNPLGKYEGDLAFYCIPVGEVNKTLKVYLNDSLAASNSYNATVTEQVQGITIPHRDHGVYTLKAILSYSTGLNEISTVPLKYEVAFVDSDSTAPLIWLSEYPEKIVDHDKLSLKFMVYDPANTTTTVRRYINGDEITELEDISYSATNWITWNISNYKIGKNTFALQCGTTTKEIIIYVEEDTVRDLDIVSAGLLVNLDTLDRSNRENRTSREKWECTYNNVTTKVKFNNFNWYNNGWLDDAETGNSILRVSNGASIEVPLSVMNLPDLSSSLTFEMRFRLRNVQKYENLIGITSEVVGTNEFGEDIVEVTKTVSSTDGVWCKYYKSNIGMCLGTQEGFFKGSSAIASGRYKEDQIVTVSFVLEAKTATNPYPLIYMYIDGVMCSIIEYDKTNEYFDSKATAIEINSDYCDVDILGIRVYKAALSSSEIVKNYLADWNNAELYDINQIVTYSNGIPTIDYKLMKTYNETHPNALLQPYAVLECVDTTEDKLPFVKGGKKFLNVEFVNPSLDKAYNDGLISDEEYLCGAPSFYATNIEFDVQGTSSQGYPRRNYKGKFKKKDNNSWKYTNGPLKDKEIGSKNTHNEIDYKGFYMDNTYSETTFTWKADYMESSMTHNTGFASFVNTLYDHHPLQDYDEDIDVTNRRTTIYGFPMIVFHKTARVNEKGEPIYDFVGRYNFNLDKGCNNVIGFEDEHPHPYVEGTFTDDDGEKPLDYAHIAECWELKHNQGGRVAFTKADFAETDSNGKLTVLEDFEYRYSYYEDDIDDAIDGKGDFEAKTQEQRNAYLLERYANLEKVTAWLASTNTGPVSVEGYVPTKLDTPVEYNGVTYEYDNREYRIAKFRNEFTKHFNTHYCAIYFIMTEFLIQYDSRGKNMMIGSWGPQEEGGEYIWYPIFYDIDTQLGVNNSGVPSWEYYDEPTKQGDFSTSGSVLWNNFYECFYNTIVDTYLDLRKNNLTYEKLNGYYTYDPKYIVYTGHDGKTHNSYVMKGHRPINIINVDQYYKYIAPTFSGYVNTSGTISYDEAKRFYCLQGNRNLHRELFLRNRFNFMDSAWLGGSYSAEAIKQEFQIRCNANKYVEGGLNNTSDRYLVNPTESELAAGFIKDGENALNADWTWNLTPYLRQYVSLRFDEIVQGNPVEYEGDGKPIAVTPVADKVTEVQNTANLTQQLFYIGGAEYISSLGDISLKYPDEIYLTELNRLKDIRLGNDTPGYYNNALTKCILGTSALNAEGGVNENAKNLLESVVLTGVSALSGAIDITGSEKLKEFRALNTNITGVTFADGVQAEVVHLPRTITFIELTEPVALQGILTEVVASGTDKDTGYNIYPNGLYIQGVTDDADNVTLINKYVITGGNMGYDSYRLLKRLVSLKQSMQSNDEIDKTKYSDSLAISLKEVNWTPYRLVAAGEEIVDGVAYMKITENSTLSSYDPSENDWATDTLNQLIYEVDANKNAEKSVINDLSLLDLFLDADNNLKDSNHNYFKDIIVHEDLKPTYPNITGNLYVANTTPISEYDIKNFYNVHYPNLNILVQTVDPAYTLKMVEINPDTGAEIVLETLKYKRQDEDGNVVTKQVDLDDITVHPSRLHNDFVGWSLDKDSNNVLTDEEVQNLIFNANNLIYTLYAVFVTTSYTANFKDMASGYSENTTVPYGENFRDPYVLPSRDVEEESRDLKDRLAFRGWTENGDLTSYVVSEGELAALKVDVESYVAEKDYTFYALFVVEDAFTTPTDDKYFTFEKVTASSWRINCNPEYSLRGKVTLPITHKDEDGNEYPITHIGNFSNALMAKHIFFLDGGQYTTVSNNAFYNMSDEKEACSLIGVYLPDSITYIGSDAFHAAATIKHLSDHYYKFDEQGHLSDNITHIGDYAFKGTGLSSGEFIINELPSQLTTLGQQAFFNAGPNIYFTTLPANLARIENFAFAYVPNIQFSKFGSAANEPVTTPLTYIGNNAFAQFDTDTGANRTVDSIYIYSSVRTIDNNAFLAYGKDPQYHDDLRDSSGNLLPAQHYSMVKVYSEGTDMPVWFNEYTGLYEWPIAFSE